MKASVIRDLLSLLASAGGIVQLILLYWVVVDTDAWSKSPFLLCLYGLLALATVLLGLFTFVPHLNDLFEKEIRIV